MSLTFEVSAETNVSVFLEDAVKEVEEAIANQTILIERDVISFDFGDGKCQRTGLPSLIRNLKLKSILAAIIRLYFVQN